MQAAGEGDERDVELGADVEVDSLHLACAEGIKPADFMCVFGTTDRAAEKLEIYGRGEKNAPQGLKANNHLTGFIGTSKLVP